MRRVYRLLGWSYVALCVALVVAFLRTRATSREELQEPPAPAAMDASAAAWFRRVKPYCNSVEVTTLERTSPPPATVDGAGFHAACFALAGRVDDARRIIDGVAPGNRN